MRKTRTILITVLTALTGVLIGCGPVNSLNPLFTDGNSIFDRRLVGEWTEKGPDHATLRFEQAGPGVYHVTSIESEGKIGTATETPYEAHLVGLGAYRFLDVVPLQMTATGDTQALGPWATPADQTRLLPIADGFYLELQGAGSFGSDSPGQASLRRGHWIFSLNTSGRTLKLAALDADWLKDALAQGDVALSHQFVRPDNKEFVLTAASRELQQLVLEHATDQKAFPDWTVFQKLR